ncbi:hypothetical protein SFC08_04465 [Lysinibacillus halotolerans]
MAGKLINQKQLADKIKGSSTAVGRYTKEFKKYLPNFTQIKGKSVMYNETEAKAIEEVKRYVNFGIGITDSVRLVLKNIYGKEVMCEKCLKLENEVSALNKFIHSQNEIINKYIEKEI